MELIVSIITILLLFSILIIILIYSRPRECFEDISTIDVVYTWVDSNDPQWRNGYNKHFNTKKYDARVSNTKRSWDELELSIKLVRKNIPWVNNIYVVTQRPQKPPKSILSKVKIIHHDQIGLKHNTYNSMSIESLLHKIPGLAERFIYFNDDMYILKPMKKTDFFTPRGVPILQLSRHLTNSLESAKDNQFTRNLKNIKKLVLSKGITFNCITHTPTPMTKRLMGKTKTLFNDNWTYTQLSTIRSDKDIIPFYLASCVGIYMNNCKVNNNNHKVFFSENDIPNSSGYDIACINSANKDTFDKFKKRYDY